MSGRRPILIGQAILWAILAGCGAAQDEVPPEAGLLQGLTEEAAPREWTRRSLGGDVYAYSGLLPVGPGAAERIRLHRVVRELAPWVPRKTQAAVMLLHGDFSTFESNFALGAPDRRTLAVYLAQHGVDVWGVDRRWTLLPEETTDFSGLRDQGLATAIADTRRALLTARVLRSLGGMGWGRLALLGFSRGGHLAYAYAAAEASLPPPQRHVGALVALDVYAVIPPGQEAVRQSACQRARDEAARLAAGTYEEDNRIFALLGSLARTAPADPSPIFPGLTNRGALLVLVTQTYQFFDPSPWYHLAGGVFAGDVPTDLRYAPFDLVAEWFARAAPFQAVAEEAESDALWCGEAPPAPLPLAQIRVPLLYIGAAGGFGELGRYTTQQVGSRDVTVLLLRRQPPGSEVLDLGHGDLLYGDAAPTDAWAPLVRWLLPRS